MHNGRDIVAAQGGQVFMTGFWRHCRLLSGSSADWDRTMSYDTTLYRDAAWLPPGVSDLSKLWFWLPPAVSGVSIESGECGGASSRPDLLVVLQWRVLQP